MTEIKSGMNIMRIKNIITFLLLLISTNSLSEGKWLSNGNTMINLNNVKVIQQGYNIGSFLHDDVAYDDALYEFTETDINKINSPIKRCVNGAYTMTYKEWVKKAKRDTGKIHSGYYLWDYSPIKDTSVMVSEIKSNLGYSLTEIDDITRDIKSLGIQPPTNDELFEMYNNITSYSTFANRYLYDNYTSNQDWEKVPKISMNPLKIKEMYKGLDNVINSLLPVSIDEYERWLVGSEERNQYYKNTIIEETYNLKNHYLYNTKPMHHNSIKFDDFELWISGDNCEINLVSTANDSRILIRGMLSKISIFINNDDEHYMELYYDRNKKKGKYQP